MFRFLDRRGQVHHSHSTCPDFALAFIGDLQALAATATGYYDTPMQQSGATHGYPHQNGTGYYAPTQQPNTSSYGQVYYTVNGHGGDISNHGSFESRKRDYEALNDFFGDAKRRQFNPNSYADVGDRLMAFQGLQLPMIHSGVMPDYQPAPSMVSVGGGQGGGMQGPMPQLQYALPPMPNLRTKNDLLNIDQFLEQMQATVYENPNTAAAAGVAYPGAHVVHGGMNYRQSNSPPGVQLPSSHTASRGSVGSMTVPTSSQSNHGDTPALTPPSSALSYTSGHSPMSATSGNSGSPHSQSGAQMYPTLPASTANGMAGYAATSTAPASVLGTIFDNDQRRRYSGGQLQKASKPPRDNDADDMDTSDGSTTPVDKARKPPETSTERNSQDNNNNNNKKPASSSLIDPTLSGISSPAESETERSQESWVENIRVIEALRKFIAEKLEKGDYDDGKETWAEKSEKSEPSERGGENGKEVEMTDAKSLYPILRAVQA